MQKAITLLKGYRFFDSVVFCNYSGIGHFIQIKDSTLRN